MIMLLAASFLLVQAAVAAPNVHDCPAILVSAGATSKFPQHTAHAIHSMTVRTLQMFEPSATVDNHVPTADHRAHTLEHRIKMHALESRKRPSKAFLTDGIRILDSVLGDMDDNLMMHETIVEQIAHTFHMEEFWAYMVPVYRRIKQNPPKNTAAVCRCAMDVENNGIIQYLLDAGKRRHYEDKLARPEETGDARCQLRSRVLNLFESYEPDKEERLADESSNVCGTAAWLNNLRQRDPDQHTYDPSLFLFCALNHPGGNGTGVNVPAMR